MMTTANTESAQVIPNPAAENASPAPSDVTPTSEVVTQVANDEAADSTPAIAETPSTQEPESEGRSRARERIEDLVAERNAAKEYADYWRQKALEVIQPTQVSPQAPAADVLAPSVGAAPTLEQFKGDSDKWQKAYSDWTDRKIEFRLQQVEANKQATETLSAFEQKIEKFKETHPDFDILMQNPKLPSFDRTASQMIVASDHSADITYALAKDPSLAVRISRMRPEQQALAIGNLAATIAMKASQQVTNKAPQSTQQASAKPAPVVKTTSAPPPPEPVPAGGIPDASPETMDTRDWMRARRDEIRSRRRR